MTGNAEAVVIIETLSPPVPGVLQVSIILQHYGLFFFWSLRIVLIKGIETEKSRS